MATSRRIGLALGAAALVLAAGACGSDTSASGDGGSDVLVGKGDFSGKPTLVFTGDVAKTVAFGAATQCEIGQFSVLAAWPNTGADPGWEMPVMHLIWMPGPYRAPVAGAMYDGNGPDGWLAFDGLGYSSERGDGCAFTVSGYSNTGAGGRAGFALTLADCELRTSDGKTARVSGEIGCSGAGFDRIDLGEEPRADAVGGDAAPGDAAPGDDATPAEDATPGEDAEGDALEADTTAPDVGPDVVVADPCDGACGADEACVAAACVRRATQTQPSCSYEPTKACDAGEDGDCADGHACVLGLCRKLACQTQPSCSYQGTRPCEADDECAAAHACVVGLCRKLACQTQPSCSYEPTRVCEGDDGDCDAGHVCVGDLCRKLACQTQPSCSYAPTRPCEDAGDCADGHVCDEDARCRKASCL
ncbi:MAG: hypothetical protein KC635_29145 [Myxococcales bacterium]|nr:hypothetical protein [Myxococcales bacterium]MCB9734976.1 hypothetical protein [Deltaproteobacteria bacterium]